MRVFVLIVLLVLFASGCAEFAGGFATGAAAMKAIADDAQEKSIKAVNELNIETAKINARIEGIKGTILVKPETLEAVKGLKGREKDPLTWIALASVLANAFFGGKGYAKKKTR